MNDPTEHNRQQDRFRAARMEIEARDRLFSVAAHELRGPLAVIELQTSALAKQLRKRFADAGEQLESPLKAVETLKRQGNQLAALVEALLDVGSIGAGRLRLNTEETDLAEVVRTVVERSVRLLQQSGSEVKVETRSARGRWDRVRVEQVVTNLVSNAAKYGQGRPIRVAVDGNERVARLVVEDQGDGIPVEDRERIFSPDERMASATKVSGLGLYIASEIVKAHRGTIAIEDNSPRGSRFVVDLPARENPLVTEGIKP